jgi:DNA-binding response OmpR family regulator
MSGLSLKGSRVLVVEDEMLVSLLIEDILTDEGCTIVGPYDRFEGALVAARNETIDLAVLDVNLAGVKVFPVAEALAERGIPFLFLSGYGQGVVPAAHPEWRVCSKPFRPGDLASMLREQLVTR